MKIKKLVIAVTFHYKEERIKYLEKIASQFHLLSDELSVHIFTNQSDEYKKLMLIGHVKQSRNFEVEIHTPTYLGHAKLLTWSHLYFFRKLFNSDLSISHFMYLEDDIFITLQNIEYWLKARQALATQMLIPSFLRYELKKDSEDLYATDCTKKVNFFKLPKIKSSVNYYYLNLPEPYQGMYLLDRELMSEHLNGASSIPEYTPWGISEKAAAGLTFMKVPQACYSRNFIGYDLGNKRIDQNSLIHHLPNNYANNSASPHGKIKVNELVIFNIFSLVLSKLLDHPFFPKIFLSYLGRKRQKM
jgi:hypothetical protein